MTFHHTCRNGNMLAHTLKSIYFKMDNVPVFDTYHALISLDMYQESIKRLNFILKKNSDTFQIHQGYMRYKRWKTDTCGICDVSIIFWKYVIDEVMVFSFLDISSI